MLYNKCGFASPELTHRALQCVSLHPELPSCLTSLTDSKVATVGLTGFLYQRKKEGEKNVCHLFWRVISNSRVHLMVKSCNAVSFTI